MTSIIFQWEVNFLNFCDSFKMLYSIVKTSLIDEPFYNGLKAFAVKFLWVLDDLQSCQIVLLYFITTESVSCFLGMCTVADSSDYKAGMIFLP